MAETRSNLFFDLDAHPEDTFKAFLEFTQRFILRYNAQFPDPPKVSLELVIERWKMHHATTDTPNPMLDLEQYDQICNEWQSKDRVTKFIGIYSSK